MAKPSHLNVCSHASKIMTVI